MVKGSKQARGAEPDSRQLGWEGCDPRQKRAYGQDSVPCSLGAGVCGARGDGVEGEAEHGGGAGVGPDLWDRLGLSHR